MDESKPIEITISEGGLFIESERLNMLEYTFQEIRKKNHFDLFEQDNSGNANCVICYDYNPAKLCFFKEMDIWFTSDESSITENNLAAIAKYYELYKTCFIAEGHKYKLRAKINSGVSGKIGEEFIVETGLSSATYNCKFNFVKSIGLYCYHLRINNCHPKDYLEQPQIKMNCKLWKAVQHNNLKSAKRFIEKGADVNFLSDNHLTTVLDVVIASNNPEMCELLLQHGVDVNHINGYGPSNSSIRLARKDGFFEVEKVLLKYGAK